MIITTTSTTMIPTAIYIKNAERKFSNKPIINIRIAIIDIPIPVVLHNFFSSYFSSYNKCIASRNDGYALILSIDL